MLGVTHYGNNLVSFLNLIGQIQSGEDSFIWTVDLAASLYGVFEPTRLKTRFNISLTPLNLLGLWKDNGRDLNAWSVYQILV